MGPARVALLPPQAAPRPLWPEGSQRRSVKGRMQANNELVRHRSAGPSCRSAPRGCVVLLEDPAWPLTALLLKARTLAAEAEHDGVAAVVALCWVLQPRRGAGARAGAEGTSAKRSAGPHRRAAPRATTATCWTWRAKTASARSPTFIAEFFDIIAP